MGEKKNDSSESVVSARFPHCDQYVLHAPGECVYCDKFPVLQQARKDWGINFTGHDDDGKQSCPAEYRRKIETIYKWSRNRPQPPVPQWAKDLAKEIYCIAGYLADDYYRIVGGMIAEAAEASAR